VVEYTYVNSTVLEFRMISRMTNQLFRPPLLNKKVSHSFALKIKFLLVCGLVATVMHLSMVCPRMGGSGNPREFDFVRRTWVGILTSQ